VHIVGKKRPTTGSSSRKRNGMLRDLTSSHRRSIPFARMLRRKERFFGSLMTPGITPSTDCPQLAPMKDKDAASARIRGSARRGDIGAA
jgi:hypothetical protein